MQPQPLAAPAQRTGPSTATYVAIGCGLILLLACCMGGIAGGIYWALKAREPAPPPGGGAALGSIVVSGTVTSATGLAAVAPGTPCSFSVEQRDSGTCKASVICGGTTLYGSSADNGFFPCSSFSTSPAGVVGADGNTTSGDNDPAFSIDTTVGTFTVSDDATGSLGAFSVTARISSVD